MFVQYNGRMWFNDFFLIIVNLIKSFLNGFNTTPAHTLLPIIRLDMELKTKFEFFVLCHPLTTYAFINMQPDTP